MKIFRVEARADDPLAAAAAFYAGDLKRIAGAVQDHLMLVFPPADHRHRGWRVAIVQQLARDFAPSRVNAVASDDEAAIAAAHQYLETAPAITGHYLPLDGEGAGLVIG